MGWEHGESVMAIKMIVGLGNPGEDYHETRHNLGFMVVDRLLERFQGEWVSNKRLGVIESKLTMADEDLRIFKPQKYMNLSGEVMQKVASFYKIPPKEMLVVYDDINIELGRCRLSDGGGAGGHNGVANLIEHFGQNFMRLRLGIGTKATPEMDLTEHVLGKLEDNEKVVLTKQMEGFINNIILLIKEGPEKAMISINQRKKTHDQEEL